LFVTFSAKLKGALTLDLLLQRNARERTAPRGDVRCLACCKRIIMYAKYVQQHGRMLTATVSQKKGATLTMAIALSVLDQFAKFFHCCKQQ